MIRVIKKEFCNGCGACAAVCPQNAVHMKENWEGFLYPSVRKSICTACGLCEQVCSAAERTKLPEASACFGARAKEDRFRMLGTSGGIFPLLAAQVLLRGGSVWGAAFGEDGVLRHIEIFKKADIAKISRTKYVQSDLSQVWTRIQTAAAEGRLVLFCGTPCQTEAVRAFLGSDRGRVVLVDLVCFGVPSPGIWRRYALYLERRYGGKLELFSFRDKRNHDSGHTCMAQVGGVEHVWASDRDLYCRSYFRNVNQRPSCFHCRYCTTNRNSDITLGDFWGIEEVQPGFDDGMGCSAVICHTEVGKRLWERVCPELQWFVCSEAEIANKQQPCLRKPGKAHPRRWLYMLLWRFLPISAWLKLIGRL